jgi:hypothetical protein
MQNSSPETGSTDNLGIQYKIMARLMVLFSHKGIWQIAVVFFLAVLLGYWLGSKLVVTTGVPNLQPVMVDEKNNQVVTLIEVSDLAEPQPALLSVWFIHLIRDDQPVLGFTPVFSITMQDDPNFAKFADFSLDANGNPSREFLKTLENLKVHSSGYLIVDQKSAAALVNWTTGVALNKPLELQQHSMAEYGQILRSMCNALPADAEKGIGEFPWSKFTSDNIRTSLSFTQVIENTRFLFLSGSPHCEMVTLPK